MNYNLYIPQVYKEQKCNMNPLATAFAKAWLDFLGGTANKMLCDERLIRAAQVQADFLSENDFQYPKPHIGLDGITANERVAAQGYYLPWGDGNNVESATRSWSSPEEAAVSLAQHSTHKDHMQLRDWFKYHIVWGVGTAAAKIDGGGTFYVVVSAPIEGERYDLTI